MPQGLMMVDLDGHRCRLMQQRGGAVVYIEYLATAPWNSPLFTPKPRYTLVGTVWFKAPSS